MLPRHAAEKRARQQVGELQQPETQHLRRQRRVRTGGGAWGGSGSASPAGGFSWSGHREERYDIINCIISKPAFVVPVASGRKVGKLLDLCGLRLAFPAGSAQEQVAKQVSVRCVAGGQPALTMVPLADQNQTVLAAQSGRADATGMQYAAALYLQKVNPGKFTVQTDETDALGILHQGFILKKGAELTPVMHEAMKRLWASGEYRRIMDKWGLAPAMAPEPRLNPASSAAK